MNLPWNLEQFCCMRNTSKPVFPRTTVNLDYATRVEWIAFCTSRKLWITLTQISSSEKLRLIGRRNFARVIMNTANRLNRKWPDYVSSSRGGNKFNFTVFRGSGNSVERYFEANRYRFLSPLSRWTRLANNRETQIAIFSGN